MKKKMLGLLLSTAMLATTVAGCGSTAATTASAPAAEETAKTEAAESTAADTADTETEAGDGSELAYAGELEIMHYSPKNLTEMAALMASVPYWVSGMTHLRILR